MDTKNQGIPLTVANTDEGFVTFEDPEGIQFTVPRKWVKENVEEFGDSDRVDHTSLKAPKGELEKIWRQAAFESPVAVDSDELLVDANNTKSLLDKWKDGTYRPGAPSVESPEPVGGFGGQADSEAQPVMMPGPANAASAFQASRAQLQRRNPTNAVPANAGTGWGNWDQVYDATKKRWKKDPNSQ